jgi:recombination protein RecT
MNTLSVTAPQQAPAPARKIEVLKKMLNAPSVQEQFNNALAKSAPTFVASVIDLYNGDGNLQQCEPKEVVMEALKAAVLKLPINKALGYAYIIPFNNSVRDERGNWTKKMTPTFQMGYKGYIQLAMRTGQYRTINADSVYEGELRKVNKLTGEIAFDGEKKSDKVTGYFCYFELLNGFSKTLYMTVEQMANHAKRYSKGLKKETTVESLMALADLPIGTDSKTVGWLGNFHGMALKTVIRILLSKYGYLSIEMQQAITNDSAAEDRDDSDRSSGDIQTIDVAEASYEDVTGDTNQQTAPEVDPGY